MDGGNLILAGHEKRGCLYAVYSFLQDVVGVRWWTPEDTFIPKKPTLVVADDLNVSYAPQMISREMYHRDAQPTVFSARMKGNGSLTAGIRRRGADRQFRPFVLQVSPAGKVLRRPSRLVLGNRRQTQA